MGLIGRNEPCYCGSGKKYKKCCLQLDEQKLQKGILPKPPGNSFEIAKTTHDIKAGIKELALAQLEQIIIWLSKEHVQDNLIKVNSQELYELSTTEDIIEHYLQINREVELAIGNPNVHNMLPMLRERAELLPSLTKNEKTLIRTIAEANIGEYLMLGDAQTADYSAMKILTEFCYEAIKEGIPDNELLITANLYVDSDGENKEKLVNWELGFTEDDGDPIDTIWIEWEALDELNDEYRRYAHSLHGLEEESKNELATAMYIEKTFPHKSRDHISFRGLVMTYTGILEKELKKLIEFKDGDTPDLMLKKINLYIDKNPFPSLDNIPNLYDRLEEIRHVRNDAAHGNTVGYSEFKKVKALLIDEQLLEFISWAKVELEEQEDVTQK